MLMHNNFHTIIPELTKPKQSDRFATHSSPIWPLCYSHTHHFPWQWPFLGSFWIHQIFTNSFNFCPVEFSR